ncbi:MAG: alpha/beta hydrolase [Fibrobacterota bacterium]|nr:alpha/beta hydrolase [Fibrobacterota bacterium]
MFKTALFQHKYVPALRPGPEEKVLVMLHGLGDSLNGFTWMPGELRLENLSYLLVNAPDDYYGGFSWFDFSGGGQYMEDAVPGILRSRKLLFELLRELVVHGIKPGNIILAGFSQGCLMALDVGLRTDLVLGGICGISGWLAFEEEYPAAFSPTASSQKILATHGIRDPLLPYTKVETQYAHLKSLGIDLSFKGYDKDHTLLPVELADIRAWLVERTAGLYPR